MNYKSAASNKFFAVPHRWRFAGHLQSTGEGTTMAISAEPMDVELCGWWSQSQSPPRLLFRVWRGGLCL